MAANTRSSRVYYSLLQKVPGRSAVRGVCATCFFHDEIGGQFFRLPAPSPQNLFALLLVVLSEVHGRYIIVACSIDTFQTHPLVPWLRHLHPKSFGAAAELSSSRLVAPPCQISTATVIVALRLLVTLMRILALPAKASAISTALPELPLLATSLLTQNSPKERIHVWTWAL